MITSRARAMRPLVAWLVGLAIGVVGTLLTFLLSPYGLLVYVLVAVAFLLVGYRPALAGAMLLVTGIWFTYIHFSMIQACAERNSATGSCTVVDASGTAVPALTFVLVGAVMSVYALGKRSVRGGE